MVYNKTKQDFHMHTTFSDGKATPEEMVKSAIEKGLERVGISDHSYIEFDSDWAMLPEKYREYICEIARLREAYKDQIEVFCGIEQDMFSPSPAEILQTEQVSDVSTDKEAECQWSSPGVDQCGSRDRCLQQADGFDKMGQNPPFLSLKCGFDYIIGSAHYVRIKGGLNPAYAGNQNGFSYNGSYLCIDASAVDFEQGCEKYFAGDFLALAEAYFDTVSHVVEVTNCDIIGHFDLVGKFNCPKYIFESKEDNLQNLNLENNLSEIFNSEADYSVSDLLKNLVQPENACDKSGLYDARVLSAKGKYFDENDPRYVSAWKKAADILLGTGRPFEINTRPYYLGLRPYPYPAPPIIAYLKERGARFIISSDSHNPETIARGFDFWAKKIED